jgi:nanoRNase/pAp phosphatase (c-di-AMP/oligoRNAs hydrolase)
MTAFVESCAKAAAGSAAAVARRSRGRPKARQLLRVLADKKKILITTHPFADPDAIASCQALCTLLAQKLPAAEVKVSLKGGVGGGMNQMFAQLTDLQTIAWDEATLGGFNAVILLDTQPGFANSPLPAGMVPLAVIDHHRGRGRRVNCPFCDLRPDVGATSSIIFSYFMELEIRPSPELAATLLFGIESDLAGAAGQPMEMDNIAISSLTLMADPRKLYKMRYLDLPQGYFISYAAGLNNALYHDSALMSHIDTVNSPEQPAVIADFLLRFDQVQWALVSGVFNNMLVLSLRTNNPKMSSADLMRRILRNLGEGGGHRTKAGGAIPLASGSAAEIERLRQLIRRRYLRALRIKPGRGQRLVPRSEPASSAGAAATTTKSQG